MVVIGPPSKPQLVGVFHLNLKKKKNVGHGCSPSKPQLVGVFYLNLRKKKKKPWVMGVKSAACACLG